MENGFVIFLIVFFNKEFEFKTVAILDVTTDS